MLSVKYNFAIICRQNGQHCRGNYVSLIVRHNAFAIYSIKLREGFKS